MWEKQLPSHIWVHTNSVVFMTKFLPLLSVAV
jgi:hypothetical protein